MTRKRDVSETWSSKETKLLISVWKEVAEQLENASRRKPFFDGLSAQLQKEGYERNGGQVQRKIQSLKDLYRRNKRKKLKSSSLGEGSSSNQQQECTWKYFDTVDEIIGDFASFREESLMISKTSDDEDDYSQQEKPLYEALENSFLGESDSQQQSVVNSGATTSSNNASNSLAFETVNNGDCQPIKLSIDRKKKKGRFSFRRSKLVNCRAPSNPTVRQQDNMKPLAAHRAVLNETTRKRQYRSILALRETPEEEDEYISDQNTRILKYIRDCTEENNTILKGILRESRKSNEHLEALVDCISAFTKSAAAAVVSTKINRVETIEQDRSS